MQWDKERGNNNPVSIACHADTSYSMQEREREREKVTAYQTLACLILCIHALHFYFAHTLPWLADFF